MNVQEKIISIILLEKIKHNPRSAKELGLKEIRGEFQDETPKNEFNRSRKHQ